MTKLTIEAYPGDVIDVVAEDAQRLADLLGIDVSFRFNGVSCTAAPGGSAGVLAERQQKKQSLTGEHKYANSRANGGG